LKIISVCGARPNFMKIAPLVRAFAATGRIEHVLVHTGQHYDEQMSRVFFDELGLPRPDVNLEVGSGSHAVQTASIMQRFEPLVLEHQPDAVLVVGDVNSTIACGLVAAKLHAPLIHVEAGLRSGDRTMPEEINRVLTDAISDLLFVTEPSGVENLEREGVPADRIHHVGNVMIDTLRAHQSLAAKSRVLTELDLAPQAYGVVTLHRPANVDDADVCRRVCAALTSLQEELPLVFPVHPRTRAALDRHGLWDGLAAQPGMRLISPLGYLDFLHLMANAGVVLTDSGGIQEETTVLGVACLTLRENTERPITIECGTNELVGSDPAAIRAGFERSRAYWDGDAVGGASGGRTPRIPPLWDGQAAERIAAIIVEWGAARAAAAVNAGD
jgi:UDP-N-acetylglucosamine 2-epimerase (non-hydrolysing)